MGGMEKWGGGYRGAGLGYPDPSITAMVGPRHGLYAITIRDPIEITTGGIRRLAVVEIWQAACLSAGPGAITQGLAEFTADLATHTAAYCCPL